jgi:prepilin-type N-terminal cleavage/methylation domain-containing protein
MQLIRGSRGFTLVELAVVLLVVTLLLGSVLVPLATQARQRNVAETQRILEETREALIGFAMANGRLPRPAVSVTDGSERAACAAEAECTGYIPWTALGTPKTDAFGKMIRYSVSLAYANGSFTLSTVANRSIQTRDAAGTAVALTTPLASCSAATPCTPAVIFSLGANNHGVTTDGTTVADGSATNTDEDANATNDGTAAFMYRQASESTGTTGGEFDDQVTWIPAGILFNRMVAAGRLP